MTHDAGQTGRQQPGRRWMTVVDVAEILQVSRYTVERWILAGDLRAIDVSGRRTGAGRRRSWRVSQESLTEFMERRASAPPRPARRPKRRRLEGIIEFIK